MSDVTQILAQIESGDAAAADRLFAVVYHELRRMARFQMAEERDDHTLQATALVHEAYLRLVGGGSPRWENRGHFFSAAAEAMRRILIDHARGRNAIKRGGQCQKQELDGHIPEGSSPEADLVDVLALDEALTRLAAEAPKKAQLVKLRYFAGLSLEEAAQVLGISERTAKRHWVTAKGWLFQALHPTS